MFLLNVCDLNFQVYACIFCVRARWAKHKNAGGTKWGKYASLYSQTGQTNQTPDYLQ